PDAVPDAAIDTVDAAAKATGISLVALSGTYNMAHPDSRMRQDGLRRLAVVIETAARLSIPLVTLCTGTRNAEDQWAHHPDNTDPSAWADMALEIEKALLIAEPHGVDLGIEPEQANIVTSAEDAIRLIGEMGSKRLRIVLDPANLFERANAEQARSIVAEAVERVAGHVSLAHAKDRFGNDGAC
ncbi:MAG: sugar phosphate isomerase/epimerase, partial [Mesorhizobium sp.]